MNDYQSPAITEIGSLADLTRGDGSAWEFDGFNYIHLTGPRGNTIAIPVPDITGPGGS